MSDELLQDPDFMAMALEGYQVVRPRRYPKEYMVVHNDHGWYFLSLNSIKAAWKAQWSFVDWWPLELDTALEADETEIIEVGGGV